MHIYKLVTLRALSLALLTTIFIFFILLTIGLYQHLWVVATSDIFAGMVRIQALTSLYLNPLGNLSLFSLIASATVALLSGLQALLLYHLYRARRQTMHKKRFAGKQRLIPAILVGLGMGCSACGSVVLLSLLSVFGLGFGVAASAWITYVLMFSAVGILLYSNYRLYQQTKHPLVCPV